MNERRNHMTDQGLIPDARALANVAWAASVAAETHLREMSATRVRLVIHPEGHVQLAQMPWNPVTGHPLFSWTPEGRGAIFGIELVIDPALGRGGWRLEFTGDVPMVRHEGPGPR